jgi:hypothetical protein
MALLLLGLSACSLIPLSTLWALRKLDFMSLDPSQLHALLYLPAGVQAAPEAIRITVKLRRSKASEERMEEALVLRPQPLPPSEPLPAAPDSAGPGAHWVWLSLDDASAKRLEALRARASAWKAADGKAEGRSLEIDAKSQLCRSGPPLDPAKTPLSAWVRWQAGQALLPLLDGAKVKDLDDKAEAEPLPPCGTLAG